MESGTIIMGVIIIIICIIPFMLLNQNSKKTKSQLLQLLNDLAKKHNCQISQYESGRGFAIGIDETNHFAFFYKKVKEYEYEQFVDLSKIQTCTIEKITRTAKNNGRENVYVDRLDLKFIPIAKDGAVTKFELYRSDVNLQLFDELLTINKWVKLLNDHLQQMPRPKQAVLA